MDSIYRSQKSIYDLTRKYYLLGRDHLIRELEPDDGQTVLELGCGTGRNLIAAAKKYPAVHFYGVDISEEMLSVARANILKAGLQNRITVASGDATAIDTARVFGIPQFDRVFFSYSLSMIPPWKEAMTHGIRLTKPGGAFHCVDFGQQERLPGFFKALLMRWLAAFHVEPRAEMLRHLDGEARVSGAFAETVPLYRGYAWYGAVRIQASSA